MKKGEKRNHPISSKKYEKAFMSLFSCTNKDFEIKPNWKDGPMIAKFKDQVYRIENAYDVDKDIKSLLTDEQCACETPIYQWIEVAEEVHLESDFFSNLLPKLTEKEEFEKLNIALSIYSHIKTSESFWLTIHQIGDLDLYPKAIVAAAKIYDLDLLVLELSELLIVKDKNC